MDELLSGICRSNDYSSNVASSPLKAILLNKVVVGKGYKMTQDSTSLSAPPNGYDSVGPPLSMVHKFGILIDV
jgi:hypothetical protein